MVFVVSTCNLCGGKIYHRGGSFTIWYYFPPGEVLPWDFFRGRVCHMVFLQGERLSYGILSGGGGVEGGGKNSHVTPVGKQVPYRSYISDVVLLYMRIVNKVSGQTIYNKAIRDGRPRPTRHQCVYQISS